MLKRIKVPEGKTLLSKVGYYTFVGPCIVEHGRGLRLETTFTDGTPWIYYDPEKEAAALANTKRIKDAEAKTKKAEAKKAADKKKAAKKAKEKKDAANVTTQTEGTAQGTETETPSD